MTDAKWMDLARQMRHDVNPGRQRENLMIAAMLTGGEATMFGQRVRIRLEWPDGPPWGMTEDQLRQMGEAIMGSEK